MVDVSSQWSQETFDNYKEIIERGLANGMPEKAKLILYGRIFHSSEIDEIGSRQFRELERLLGINADDLQNELEFALTGLPQPGQTT